MMHNPVMMADGFHELSDLIATRPPKQREKGHRYVRAFRGDWVDPATGRRERGRGEWAGHQLWEHDGTRYRRVGTARTEQEYRDFLGLVGSAP